MTTKQKIIAGFILIFIVLISVATIGTQALQSAINRFNTYDGLAFSNGWVSDMMADNHAQAYEVANFLTEKEQKRIDMAKEHISNSIQLGELTRPVAETKPEWKALFESAMSTIALYNDEYDKISSNSLIWKTSYQNTMVVALKHIEKKLHIIGEKAIDQNESSTLSLLNTFWKEFSSLNFTISSFSEVARQDDYNSSIDRLKALTELVKKLKVSIKYGFENDFNELEQSVIVLDTEFKEKSLNLLSAIEHKTKLRELDKITYNSLSNFNNQINDDLSIVRNELIIENSSATNKVLTLSTIGTILGLFFVVLIIVGLVKTLRKIQQYSLAIADGNFSFDPKITEKGEIGAMVEELKRIPKTLIDTITQCKNTAEKISSGEFRIRLDAKILSGGFQDLGNAINTIADSYTQTIDNLPISILGTNNEENIVFMNSFGEAIVGKKGVGKKLSLSREQVNSSDLGEGEIALKVNNTIKYYSCSYLPLIDTTGTKRGIIEIINDISLIKEQQILITKIANQAIEISNKVSDASEQLSNQVSQVAKGAEIQTRQVESTAGAMSEMNATVLEVARNASEASEQSEKTKINAQDGAILVKDVTDAINDVNQIAKTLQENMLALGSQAENIGSVMNVISDIADQTNLLALNAAIEAARAGDAGRGFAVVADEVRKLAENTMSATKEVGESITAIQSSTQNNIHEVGNAVKKVESANELANSSGEALSGIVQLAGSTSSVITSIATATEQQSATSEEITRSVDEINEIVIKTSQEMAESANAVQEVTQMVQDLKILLDELKK